MDQLTLIIPAKKESESLPIVLNELASFNFKINIVLHESDVETIKSIQNFKIKIIYQKNFGYGDALIEGINKCETKYFCIFNADGSFDPKEITKMMDKIIKNEKDFLFGSRYEKNAGSEDDTLITFVGNFIFTLLGNIFFRLNISDILYTFVIGKTKEAKSLNLISRDFAFCVELPIKAKKTGYKLETFPCQERARIAGIKKVNAFKDGFLILLAMIKLFFK